MIIFWLHSPCYLPPDAIGCFFQKMVYDSLTFGLCIDMFDQRWSFVHKNEDFDQTYLNTGSKTEIGWPLYSMFHLNHPRVRQQWPFHIYFTLVSLLCSVDNNFCCAVWTRSLYLVWFYCQKWAPSKVCIFTMWNIY